MRQGAVYLLAHFLPIAFGLPTLWLEPVRSWRPLTKAAAAFAVGTVVLAVEATLATILGLRWSFLALLAPPALLALKLWRRAPGPGARRAAPFRPGRGASALLIASTVVSFLGLGWRLATAQSTSADYLLFWGPKAVRFAQARAVDPVILTDLFFEHARPFYPPLVPVVDAAGVLVAGRLPWRVGPLTALFWLGAAAILLLEATRRLGDRAAALLTAFWIAALAASLGVSYSGGNAEAPLLLFLTAAGALLMTEGEGDPAARRWLIGLLLAGAVLTKVEGTVAGVLIILGTALGDRLPPARRPISAIVPLLVPPLCAGLLWVAFLVRFHVHVRNPGRGSFLDLDPSRMRQVLGSFARALEGGTLWLAWVVPLALLLAVALSRGVWRPSLPALFVIVGSILFFLAVYLHEPGNPSERIAWEIPRLTQPAMSLLIISAGLASLSREEDS